MAIAGNRTKYTLVIPLNPKQNIQFNTYGRELGVFRLCPGQPQGTKNEAGRLCHAVADLSSAVPVVRLFDGARSLAETPSGFGTSTFPVCFKIFY
eukprot:IDg18719t1